MPANPDRDTSWMEFAACRGLDPALFYPEQGEEASVPKMVCQTCVVRPACLDHALAENEKHGVWGGASERERRRIKKLRRLAAGEPNREVA